MAAAVVPIGDADPAVVRAGVCAAWPLPPDERGAGFARAVARAVLAELRMPDVAVYDAAVALSELATNVYLHAYGGRDAARPSPPGSTASSPYAMPGGLGGAPELWAYVRWRTRGAPPAPWEPEIVFKVYDAAPWRRPVPSPPGPGIRWALPEGTPGPVPAPASAVGGWGTGAGTPPGASGAPGDLPPKHPPGYPPPRHPGYRSPSHPSTEPRIVPHAPVPPRPQPYAEAGRGLELVNALAVEYGGEWGVHRTRSRLGAGPVPGKAVYFTMPIPAGAVEPRRATAPSVAEEIRDVLTARGIGPLQMSADRDIAVAPSFRCALAATEYESRERHLGAAYEAVAALHNETGLTAPLSTGCRRYHDRPYQVLFAERFATAARETVTDPWLRTLPLTGSVDQWADGTDFLGSGRLRRSAIDALP